MSETGFTTGGFFIRSPAQLFNDYARAASGVYEEINFGPGSAPQQLSKIIVYREREIELLLQSMVSGLSVETAYGDFLLKIGLEKGIPIKGPQKAGGYIRLNFNAPGEADTPYNLAGTVYSTPDGKNYYRSNTGVSRFVRNYIGITRGVRNFDGLPAPYEYIAGTGYVSVNINGTGTAYNPLFNVELQTFNWANATSYPATGATYYIGVSGNSIIVKDDVAAGIEGTGYNIGINVISNWSNNATLPTDTTVNNPYDITGGADWEDQEEYRERIKRSTSRSFTVENIRSISEGVVGVRAAYVYQDIGEDRISANNSWIPNATGFTNGIKITGSYSGIAGLGDYVSGNMYAQRFSPGTAIMGLKQVTFRGQRIGIPPPLVVALRNINTATYISSGIFDTYDVKPPAATMQDYEVSIEYLDLSPTETYTLDFYCSDKSGASGASYWNSNYWLLATGDADSGNLGSTGLLYLGGTVQDVNTIFKTHYGASAVNIDVAVKDGYNYTEIEESIDDKLDWVSGSGFMPIGINYTINQATPVSISYSVTSYLSQNENIENTQDRVDIKVEQYIEGLQPAENVVYSQVYKNIIQDSKIWRIDDLELWESGGIHSSGQDIYIAKGEVAIFEGSTFNQG